MRHGLPSKESSFPAEHLGDMDLGLYIAASGMVAEQVRQDQLSNDLANASTPGYKPDASPQHSFGDVLVASTEGGPAVGSLDTGVALGKTYTDMTPGTVQETGEPLDFAISGSGFFAVKTAQGVRYTRDGQFTTSAQGVLTDTSGDPVLNQSGAEVKVDSKGKVPASALGIFEVPGAVKQGENLYTGTASGKPTGTVRQGALEGSGVDAAKIMVEMITSLRSFQSGQQAIQSIGQTLQEAASEVGSLNAGGG
jgi:flagellar basal-body rod protein FlgF